MDIISIIVTAGFSLLVSIILIVVQRKQKKLDEKQERRHLKEERRYEARKKRDEIAFDLQVATAELAYACAMALKRGKANGEVETAEKRYDEAMKAFREFEREQIAKM